MDDNGLPSAFFSPRGTSVFEEDEQGKHLPSPQFSNPFGITTKLRLSSEGSPLELSPRVDKALSPLPPMDSSTDSEIALAYNDAFPSLTAVNKRELESITPSISATSATATAQSFRPAKSPFLPIMGGAEEGEIVCDQPGLDIVASVDDFSKMRAFLTPSPTTLGSAARLGPPKLQRGTALDLKDGQSISDRAPSSKPTSSKTSTRALLPHELKTGWDYPMRGVSHVSAYV
jgi:hypothetical protein